MKTSGLVFSFFACLALVTSSFVYFDAPVITALYDDFGIAPDTTIIENRVLNSGSKIMTDQDALVILPPAGAKLSSIELYFTAVQTINSDSSRLHVKTQRSWSCAPLGNANPLQVDQYSLGLTNNVLVDTGWNKYTFDEPIGITSDTIYIWPDLIQQVNPRVPYALGNHNSIRTLTGTSCATQGSDTSVLDYVCSLTFITTQDCPPSIVITDADSTCYAGDTILARTIIGANKDIVYLSKDQVTLDTTFQVDETARLTVDMSGCND